MLKPRIIIVKPKRIIPQVESIEFGNKEFSLMPSTKIVFHGEKAYHPVKILKSFLCMPTGFDFAIVPACEADGNINIHVCNEQYKNIATEGYELRVSEKSVNLNASSASGAFYGIQTLRQLLPVEIFSQSRCNCQWKIPEVRLTDRPRFKWRGIMLDEGRHWYGKEYLKKFIDLLAMHKYNILHWHLTENAGWRIEIKRYPKLQTVAAWRDRTIIGNPDTQEKPYKYKEKVYGGYYTQEEIKEIVAYAAQNYITIIPEIDMPAHTQAALAAYPEMGCTGGPYKVMEEWIFSYDNFCAGNDNVFTFIENILDEVCELFPSRYIHIGGDECIKDAWNSCPKCQKRIKEEHFSNANDLQHYFISRVAKYLNTKGRCIIGWDEILESGDIPDCTVMLWRRNAAAFDNALASNKPMIVALQDYTYFDYYQGNPETEPLAIGGYLPLSKTYKFEPVPEDCPLVMGTQAQIWSQYLYDTQQLEYMTFPRAAAVAENAWTQKKNKDYGKFFASMQDYLKRLDLLKVNYRTPESLENEWQAPPEQALKGV